MIATKTKMPVTGKPRQIAAAERVLVHSDEPMTCTAMVDAMSAKSHLVELGREDAGCDTLHLATAADPGIWCQLNVPEDRSRTKLRGKMCI